MKKVFPLFTLLILLSCSSDDDDFSNPEFVDAVTGRYYLREIYTEVALDLNNDGIENTDLFLEENYCNMGLLFETYYSRIIQKNYTEISFDFPYSGLDENLNQSSCIKERRTKYDIKIDEQNEELVMLQSDYWDNFIAQYHAKVTDIYWEDEVVFITLEKKFFDTNSEWIETKLYLTFEKFSNQT